MYFQDLILNLQKYWNDKGCVLVQPYDVEKGAGTFNPATFLRALGPEPFHAAYPEPCRRPTDGRYGDNPIRMQHYYQFQVILKPNPKNILDLYLGSLEAVGIKSDEHDIRFVHDDWETAALGAWGLGWEVWCDGTEITQFTYFQQVGGVDLTPITGEITYGLERICMFLQGVESVYDIQYNKELTYGDLFHQNEIQYSHYNFELADIPNQLELFNRYEKECDRLCDAQKPNPALDYAMKASHAFNLLDARGAISVNERQAYVLKIRSLAKKVAEAWLNERKRLNYPLLKSTKETVTSSSGSSQGTTRTPTKSISLKEPLLIELGVEEMPAKVFKGLLESLPQIWKKLMEPHQLTHEPIQIFVSPRRIALYTSSIDTQQADVDMEIKGPPTSIAKDAQGNWSKAAQIFAQKNGLELDQLVSKTFGKAEYLTARLQKKGATAEIILRDVIPELFSRIPWYKTMRWAEGTGTPFVRPVQWLVALLGTQVIPTEFAGCSAGNQSRGHRYLCNKFIPVSAANYQDELRQAYVIVDQNERKALIKKQIQNIEKEKNLKWKTDTDLLDHVNYLVEYPVAIHGYFKPQYLEIPQEVLVSEMKGHQKYFALSKENGEIHNSFIAISNMIFKNESSVRTGYENVLTSRLKDGEFFLKEDQKITLEKRVVELDNLTFEKTLGTVGDKSRRTIPLSQWLGKQSKLDSKSLSTVEKIATLAKADLTTAMVFEFPELQGTIGQHYAKLQGFPPEVAEGISQQYLPRNSGDELPHSFEAALVGLADRLDTIVGFFGIGKQPTGSADPYALRRAAIGCLLLLMHHKISLSLATMIETAIDGYPESLFNKSKTETKQEVLEFFKQRIIRLFGEQRNYPSGGQDIVKSVMTASSAWDSISDLSERVKAMNEFKQAPDFKDVAATFKRVNNILDASVDGEINPQLFEHPEEHSLYKQTSEKSQLLRGFILEKKYTEALKEVGTLRQPTDSLFEKVLLNDKNEEVRRNRHLLIRAVKDLVFQVADFSAVQDPG